MATQEKFWSVNWSHGIAISSTVQQTWSFWNGHKSPIDETNELFETPSWSSLSFWYPWYLFDILTLQYLFGTHLKSNWKIIKLINQIKNEMGIIIAQIFLCRQADDPPLPHVDKHRHLTNPPSSPMPHWGAYEVHTPQKIYFFL